MTYEPFFSISYRFVSSNSNEKNPACPLWWKLKLQFSKAMLQRRRLCWSWTVCSISFPQKVSCSHNKCFTSPSCSYVSHCVFLAPAKILCTLDLLISQCYLVWLMNNRHSVTKNPRNWFAISSSKICRILTKQLISRSKIGWLFLTLPLLQVCLSSFLGSKAQEFWEAARGASVCVLSP